MTSPDIRTDLQSNLIWGFRLMLEDRSMIGSQKASIWLVEGGMDELFHFFRKSEWKKKYFCENVARQTKWKSMTFGMAWSVLENFMFFVMNKHEPSSLKRAFLEFLEFLRSTTFFLFEPGIMSLKVQCC